MSDHQLKLQAQIENQSNEAIRCLLLELETGGNARIEDEQKSASWVTHCEKQIKRLIRKASSKNSPKTIQIHRISKFHNRGAKLQFDERVARGGADRGEYLCYTNRSDECDVFTIAENGFGGFEEVAMADFFDCVEGPPSGGKLRKAIIVRTCQMQSQEVGKDGFSEFRQHFPTVDALSRPVDETSRTSDGQNHYMVYNTECVLPEYLVEYSLESDLDAETSQIERLLLDIAYSNRISYANMPIIVQELASKVKQNPSLLVVPAAPEPAEFAGINRVVIQNQSYWKNETKVLNLSCSSLALEDYFSKFLTTITINHAQMVSFPKIVMCPSLEALDLSFNSIESIPLDLCTTSPKLKKLFLISNRIKTVILFAPSSILEEIDLRFNPVSKTKDLISFLLSKVPTLLIINTAVLSKSKEPVSWNQKFQSCISDQTESFRPLSIRTSFGIESSSLEQNYYHFKFLSSIPARIEIDSMTALELDSCHLTNLDAFPERMEKLRWASLRDNHLVDISKLSNYTSLEELCLERNHITDIDPLSSLPSLVKLDVSGNQISTVEKVIFKSLTFLSLENNCIKSLRPFSKIPTLFELCN